MAGRWNLSCLIVYWNLFRCLSPQTTFGRHWVLLKEIDSVVFAPIIPRSLCPLAVGNGRGAAGGRAQGVIHALGLWGMFPTGCHCLAVIATLPNPPDDVTDWRICQLPHILKDVTLTFVVVLLSTDVIIQAPVTTVWGCNVIGQLDGRWQCGRLVAARKVSGRSGKAARLPEGGRPR